MYFTATSWLSDLKFKEKKICYEWHDCNLFPVLYVPEAAVPLEVIEASSISLWNTGKFREG